MLDGLLIIVLAVVAFVLCLRFLIPRRDKPQRSRLIEGWIAMGAQGMISAGLFSKGFPVQLGGGAPYSIPWRRRCSASSASSP